MEYFLQSRNERSRSISAQSRRTQLVVKISTWTFRIAFFDFSRQWSTCQTRSLQIIAQFNVLILVYIATYLAKIWEQSWKSQKKSMLSWERRNLAWNTFPDWATDDLLFFLDSPRRVASSVVIVIVESRLTRALRVFPKSRKSAITPIQGTWQPSVGCHWNPRVVLHTPVLTGVSGKIWHRNYDDFPLL